jgi:hypothetical protein
LSSSYYLTQKNWLKERKKLEWLHSSKDDTLFSSLWKRDKGLCYLCETSLADELTNFENTIEIHHKLPFSEGGPNEKTNLALVHKSCHESWHEEYSTQATNNKIFFTKNRQTFKE